MRSPFSFDVTQESVKNEQIQTNTCMRDTPNKYGWRFVVGFFRFLFFVLVLSVPIRIYSISNTFKCISCVCVYGTPYRRQRQCARTSNHRIHFFVLNVTWWINSHTSDHMMCLCDSLCCVVDSIATTNTIPSNWSHTNDRWRCSKWEVKKLFADSLSIWQEWKTNFRFHQRNQIAFVTFNFVLSLVSDCVCVSHSIASQSLDEFKTTTTTSSGICPNIVAGCSIRFDRCWYERKRN